MAIFWGRVFQIVIRLRGNKEVSDEATGSDLAFGRRGNPKDDKSTQERLLHSENCFKISN